MRIAILGGSSHIARDYALSSAASREDHEFVFFGRDPARIGRWLSGTGLRGSAVHGYENYTRIDHDAVINFIGVGTAAAARKIGSDILRITRSFDDLVVESLRRNPERKYVFISSGAVYGRVFDRPAERATLAAIPINEVTAHDCYGVTKLAIEAGHRAAAGLPIVDVRVFSYFSRSQDLASGLFMGDLVRALVSDSVLVTRKEPITRDYIDPSDLCSLLNAVLAATPFNGAVDCYSRASVTKDEILGVMRDRFGLRVEYSDIDVPTIAGRNSNYYSLDRAAGALGYNPRFRSIETLDAEVSAILASAGVEVHDAR